MKRLTTEPPLDPPEEIPYAIKPRIQRQRERRQYEADQDEESCRQRMQDDGELEWAILQQQMEEDGRKD